MQVELPLHRERIEDLGFEVLAPDLGTRQQFTAANYSNIAIALWGGSSLVTITLIVSSSRAHQS